MGGITSRPIVGERRSATPPIGSHRCEGETKFHTPHVVVMSLAKCCRIKRAVGVGDGLNGINVPQHASNI